MRNPYIVGRWLCGDDHYGRHRLLDYLIQARDPAIWVVGTRRMGKTSLLRQLEWLTDHPDSALVPLFWDLQGCENGGDLSYELFVSVEDVAQRFAPLGVDIDSLYNVDAIRIMRTLQRALRRADKQLLLLIDETEALVNVAERDGQMLALLRKVFQSGNQRTIMTATKSLLLLNDLNSHWLTSPFLFGVSMVNLWQLDPESGRDLVLQKQASHRIEADGELVSEILEHTHRHPYLIQYLCHRIFESSSENAGTLRPIQEDDLRPDHLLAGFFQVDFEHLTSIERQILLTVSRHGLIDTTTLTAELSNVMPSSVEVFLYGMMKLGYIRQLYGQWTLGNEFLRRWVVDNYDHLSQNVESQLSDHSVETLLVVGQQIERDYLQQELRTQQEQLDLLLEKRARYGANVPLSLSTQIQDLRRTMDDIRSQLRDLNSTSDHLPGQGPVAD